MTVEKINAIEVGDVDCGECEICCQNAHVLLLPEDFTRRFKFFGKKMTEYKTQPHPMYEGEKILARNNNGSCVYLSKTTKGCSIHESKPTMCKKMDCRTIAASVPWTKARKLPGFPIAVWQKGREKIKSAV